VNFIVFGGTWCEDTQNLLPQFYKLQELTGMKEDRIVFFGVDRDKKTIDNIAQTFNITNVPTIIVMKDGKEAGRVVEYGSSGNWDEAMTNLLK
jgi:thiol-disulfide isomerase/thioredoxin